MVNSLELPEVSQALSEKLWAAIAESGIEGVERLWTEVGQELAEGDQAILTIQFAEFLLFIPGYRQVMSDRLEKALETLSQTGAVPWVLRAMAVLIRIHLAESDELERLPEAIDTMERLARASNVPLYAEFAQILRAEFAIAQGSAEEGISQLEQWRSILTQRNSDTFTSDLQVYLLTRLLRIYAQQGAYDRLKKRLSELKTLTDWERSPTIFFYQGVLAQATGLVSQAIAHYQHTLQLSEGHLEQGWAIESLIALAALDPERAAEYLQPLEQLLDENPDSGLQQRLTFAHIRAALNTGKDKEAREILLSLPNQDNPDLLTLCAEVFAKTGPPAEAYQYAQRLLRVKTDQKLPGGIAYAHVLVATTAQSSGERLLHARRAGALYLELKDIIGCGMALNQQAFAELELGDRTAAIDHGQKVLEIGQRYQRRDLEASALVVLGIALSKKTYLQEALTLAEQNHLASVYAYCQKALNQWDSSQESE